MSISSISKHADFVAIDVVSLAAAFAGAYLIKFGNLEFINSPSWRGLLAFLMLSDLLVTLHTNPYSGIFRRRYWEDIRIQSACLDRLVMLFVIMMRIIQNKAAGSEGIRAHLDQSNRAASNNALACALIVDSC